MPAKAKPGKCHNVTNLMNGEIGAKVGHANMSLAMQSRGGAGHAPVTSCGEATARMLRGTLLVVLGRRRS